MGFPSVYLDDEDRLKCDIFKELVSAHTRKRLQQALKWAIESLSCLIDGSVSGSCSFQPVIFNDSFIRYNEKEQQVFFLYSNHWDVRSIKL